MELKGEAILLRIFLGSLDKINGKPLYEEIVFEAKRNGLAGATVLKGIMGFGASSFVHSAKILDISDELPFVIEIIDEETKINNFIQHINPYLEKSNHGGLITPEKVGVLYYKGAKKS